MISTEASFRGRVKPLGIADLLFFLSDLKRDGLLTCTDRGVVIDLYIEAGRLIYVTSSRARDDLSALLLRWESLSPQRFEAAMRQVSEGARLDRALLERGGMSAEALRNARRRQAIHIVLPLFNWRDGEFRFFEGEAPQGELPSVDLPLPAIVAAGIRALRDVDLIAERIPSLERVFEAMPADRVKGFKVSLRPAEAFVLDLVDGFRTTGEIIDASGQPAAEVRRILFLLCSVGRIKARLHAASREEATADRAARSETGEIVRQFNGMFGSVYRYLMREVGPISDHLLRRSLKDTRREHPILLSGSTLGADGTLDLPPIRDNLAGLRGRKGQEVLVEGLNELLYRELLVIRRTLGPEHEKRVLTGIRRVRERTEIRT